MANGGLWILALFWVGIAVAIGIHAAERGRSGTKWFVIVGMLGVFGASYYVAREIL